MNTHQSRPLGLKGKSTSGIARRGSPAIVALQAMADSSAPVARLARLAALQRKPDAPVQREVMIAGHEVWIEGGYVCFSINDKNYHLNLGSPKHVTCDEEGRAHYFFKGMGTDIKDAAGWTAAGGADQPRKKEKDKESNNEHRSLF